ncbi:Uncharacterised protein [Pseudomonas putida]|nr:Uncharacterised protein [Pseudomonas putida]CAB5529837.1 Uncharacterised protein [Pseudomonas putida]CAB5570384.1 Uncharacterised protein [Pseudomonas putida]CAB5572058.1 Uncharacterised protein [Pseudomonas putida]CAB5653900.1 Uncharacterised protein [Pseudomonas putida]
MTPNVNHAQALQNRTGATIIPMGWPTYTAMKAQPESVRWQFYEFSKRLRADLEGHGCLFVEPYDAFVRRVTEELEL